MNDQKNTLLFIVLSAVILIGWQLFFGVPQQKPVAPPQNEPHDQPRRGRRRTGRTTSTGRARRPSR